jgi:hypothetical protein
MVVSDKTPANYFLFCLNKLWLNLEFEYEYAQLICVPVSHFSF